MTDALTRLADAVEAGMHKPVLDPCCGSRMFWFDRADDRAVFGDIRCETHILTDKSSAGGSRKLIIAPDVLMDFRALPFSSDSLSLVVFDPPHLIRNGQSGWLAKKYGKLGDDWRDDIRAGFSECFRVLKPSGTLVFKWNENDIPVADILSLTDEKPLFGNRFGKSAKSHWLVFMKPPAAMTDARDARIAELETLLARQLVFDHHAAEDALDALGGWNRMCDLVTAYREANPLPLAVSDGEEPF
jgi:SAM-dependent methyltransferase